MTHGSKYETIVRLERASVLLNLARSTTGCYSHVHPIRSHKHDILEAGHTNTTFYKDVTQTRHFRSMSHKHGII